MTNLLKDNQGFSMLEALISTSVVIGLTLVIAKTNVVSDKTNKALELKNDSADIGKNMILQVSELIDESLKESCQNTDIHTFFPTVASRSDNQTFIKAWKPEIYEGELKRCQKPRLGNSQNQFYFCLEVGSSRDMSPSLNKDNMVIEIAGQFENAADSQPINCNQYITSFEPASITYLYTVHTQKKNRQGKNIKSSFNGTYYAQKHH